MHANNNETHTQPTQDTVDHIRKRPHDPLTGTSSASKLLKEEVNAKPATTDTPPEKHPTEKRQRPVNNNIDKYTHEQGRSSWSTPDQKTPEEDDPLITNTTPTPIKSDVIKRTRKRQKVPWNPAGDLITIYESEDEVKLEENPIDTHTPHRRQAGDRDYESTPTVRRKLALDDQMPSVGMTPTERLLSSIGARRPPPLPDRMYVGQPQREIRRAAYTDDRGRSRYEYLEITTSDSETSQCPDPDSSDDDGHKDCGLGGYEHCPDNPANYRATQHRENDFDKDHPDPSDRGIT